MSEAGGDAASPWTWTGASASLGGDGGLVTLVEASTFCLSGRSGDIAAGTAHGLFVADTRVISRWQLHVAGAPLEPLTVATDTPFDATFVGRVHPQGQHADTDLIVFRERRVGGGMHERLRIENYGGATARLEIELRAGTDFANLFAVKESRVHRRRGRREGTTQATCHTDHLGFERSSGVGVRRVTVAFDRAATDVEPGAARWVVEVPAKSTFSLHLDVRVSLGDGVPEPVPPSAWSAVDDVSVAARRLGEWRSSVPGLDCDDASIMRTYARSIEDLGALRIFDPDHPESPVIAAGAPWFMTLFGRDSLLTSWMALLVDHTLAHGVLDTLARLQGRRHDPETEEEPGRILHEVRPVGAPSEQLSRGSAYYGSVDATPLFVMLVGELARWGLDQEHTEDLLPAVDRALGWIVDHGDRDGDGFVEYRTSSERGLVNQGWKDSWDAISFADGRLAEAPIALCEVQGYTYAAYRARAHLAAERGDDVTFTRWSEAAEVLKAQFNERFWLADRGWFALGLDAQKRPIDALTSNMGHCLWTGIVDEALAPAVAERLLSEDMFTGWGVRTLASSMARYNPVSYHNGSVWPHDSALCAAGLMRYGFTDAAHRIMRGLLDAADFSGGRLPELFAGFHREQLPVPAAYPTSCSPQAWASAAPLLMIRSMLHLDPAAPHRTVHLVPEPPPEVGRLALRRLRVADRRLDVVWSPAGVSTSGFGGWRLDTDRRPATGEMTLDAARPVGADG